MSYFHVQYIYPLILKSVRKKSVRIKKKEKKKKVRTLEGVETELRVSFSVKSDNVLIYHAGVGTWCVVYM